MQPRWKWGMKLSSASCAVSSAIPFNAAPSQRGMNVLRTRRGHQTTISSMQPRVNEEYDARCRRGSRRPLQPSMSPRLSEECNDEQPAEAIRKARLQCSPVGNGECNDPAPASRRESSAPFNAAPLEAGNVIPIRSSPVSPFSVLQCSPVESGECNR